MILFEMSTWDHVVAAIICIVAPVLAISSRKIAPDDIDLGTIDKVRLYNSNALLLTVFSLVVITTWRIPGRPLAGIGFDWAVWHPYVPVLLFVIILFYFLDIFLQYGTKKRRESTLHKKQSAHAFIPADGNELMHFTILAFAAGIGEEIIFRGFLIHYLISWFGNDFLGITLSAIASSALFAFLHGYQGWKSMAKIFVFALLFSAIFIFSQSLLIVIIVHTIIDVISGVISVYFLKKRNEEEN